PSTESSEAFGLVQAEAMAFGLSVVNTSLPTGVPEVSKDGMTGTTVPPKDVQAPSRAIAELLAHDGLRRRYGEAARERVRNVLNERVFMQTVQNAIEHL